MPPETPTMCHFTTGYPPCITPTRLRFAYNTCLNKGRRRVYALLGPDGSIRLLGKALRKLARHVCCFLASITLVVCLYTQVPLSRSTAHHCHPCSFYLIQRGLLFPHSLEARAHTIRNPPLVACPSDTRSIHNTCHRRPAN